ncbi:hypothetical protein BB559_005049 [Furculomyces boomerangus]|uniref:Serine aminopeptidase S33 domain-containing protein n=2 Tax=Harpellales TaxID=61421 RepID=A0A2T9YB07_9FUNG|nr:hypothetical protein BB559_005049 [Furculomyces boomerangus]PWA00062.1 hypothetical protein BB558_003888 [Smittium angustum]PWA02478.1 hypothetical protein BB558_001368 [Smittium angustum]
MTENLDANPPKKMEQNEYKYTEITKWIPYGGTLFYTRLYKITESMPKAVLVLVHGYGEYSDRYENLLRVLAKYGIQGFAFDLRGFGRTAWKNGEFGHLGTMHELYGYLKYMIEINTIPDVPTFLFGHSMGGGISLCFCGYPEYGKLVSGVIASAPAISFNKRLGYSPIKQRFISAMSHLIPSFPISRELNETHITSNVEELERNRKSLYIFGILSVGSLTSLANERKNCLNKNTKTYATPVLIIHGKGDKLTVSKGSEEFISKLPSNLDKKLVLFDSEYHEMHMEKEFSETVSLLYKDWILERS